MFTRWFWNSLNFFSGIFLTTVFFALTVFESKIEIKDLDLWLHLASGRYILEHHIIPRVDIFSCTIAGAPWINHEWLFQVILASIEKVCGIEGIVGLQVFVVLFTFLLLFFVAYRQNRLSLIIPLLILVLLVYESRFTIRPDIFSILFMAVFIYRLYFQRISNSTIWILLAVQVLWTNIHGFFIFGPLLVLLASAGDWAQRTFNKTEGYSPEERQRLKIIFWAVLVGSFINPYGWQGVVYPLKVLFGMGGSSKIFFDHVKELRHPISSLQELIPFGQFAAYKWMVIVSAMSFLFSSRRINFNILLLWVLLLVFSLSALRNIVFFAVGSYFVVFYNFFASPQGQRIEDFFHNARRGLALGIVINFLLAFWIFQYSQKLLTHGYYDFENKSRKSEWGGISQRNYPVKAVDFLVRERISGNFFNDFNTGAYLIGRTFPGIKVFIDGRTEVYTAKFFKYYLKVMNGLKEDIDDAVDHYQLTGAFLNFTTNQPIPSQLHYFYNNPDWVLVYFDYDAMIFLKKIPKNMRIIDKFSIDLDSRQVPSADLVSHGLVNFEPLPFIRRAEVLVHLKKLDQAWLEIQEALKLSVNSSEAYRLAGKICMDREQWNEAFEYLRKAKFLAPQDPEIRYYLAKVYLGLEDISNAVEQAQFVLEDNPENPWGLFLMALLNIKQHNYQEGLVLAQKGHDVVPHHAENLIKIGDALFAENQLELALRVYIMAEETKADEGVVSEKLVKVRAMLEKKEGTSKNE